MGRLRTSAHSLTSSVLPVTFALIAAVSVVAAVLVLKRVPGGISTAPASLGALGSVLMDRRLLADRPRPGRVRSTATARQRQQRDDEKHPHPV